MLIIKTYDSVPTNLCLISYYNGMTSYISSIKWNWYELEMTNKEWCNKLITLNQINKNTDHQC